LRPFRAGFPPGVDVPQGVALGWSISALRAGEGFWVSGLKGRNKPAQGNTLGHRGQLPGLALKGRNNGREGQTYPWQERGDSRAILHPLVRGAVSSLNRRTLP